MANPRKWSNVGIAMQSALATALTVTAISKASEGVVTATNTLAAGDYVVGSIQGMRQLDDRVFRVKSATGTSFVLEGEDTTLFDTFVSGSFQKVTFGTSITSATTISANGGDFEFLDTTTIHVDRKSQVPGMPSAASYSFDNIWDVADVGLKAMKAASDANAKRAFLFTFGVGGPIMIFNGHVGASGLPGGAAHQLVTTKATITMSSAFSVYAS